MHNKADYDKDDEDDNATDSLFDDDFHRDDRE